MTPRHHQHQHIDRAQAMNQSSWPTLLLSHSWKAASPTKAQIYTKGQQNPRYVISSLGGWRLR